MKSDREIEVLFRRLRLYDQLDVEPQQVVLGQAEAANGWFGF
jgi:hypothetical protein